MNNLISEILEATTAADGTYGTKLKKTLVAQSLAKKDKEEQLKWREESSKQVEKLEQEVREKQKELKEAFQNQTSGWDLIGMGAVENLSKGLSAALEVGAQALATKMNPVGSAVAQVSKSTGSTGVEEAGGSKSETATPDPNDKIPTDTKALLTMQNIFKLSNTLKNFIAENGCLNSNSILDEGNGAMAVAAQLEKYSRSMNAMLGSENEVIELCRQGITIAKEFLSLAKSLGGKSQQSEALKSRMKIFCDEALKKNTVATLKLNNNPISAPGPRQQIAQRQHGRGALVHSMIFLVQSE